MNILTIAASNEETLFAGLFAGLGLGVICLGFLVALAISILICYLLYSAYKTIPAEHRLQDPALVWLLLIPLFNVVWNFFIYLKLSQSFQRFFQAHNRQDLGDCGYSLGLAYCICAAVSLIPYLGCLTSVAALILLIIYLIKIHQLKSLVLAMTAQPA